MTKCVDCKFKEDATQNGLRYFKCNIQLPYFVPVRKEPTWVYSNTTKPIGCDLGVAKEGN